MSTFIIGTIVFALLFLAIINIVKKSKNNNGGCGCNCTGCSIKNSCSSKIELKK
ncbi:FeoB-associated Cys-rich membrane protein [Clostridioides difficile]